MPHYGFNFQWMFSKDWQDAPADADLPALDFLAKHGFDFVRIPTDYRLWTKDFEYFNPDERVFEKIDSYLEACRQRDIHLCLNIHRAPGYCINRNDLEKHNLWLDQEAQDAFVFLWETFARRYKGVPSKHLSFDLVNEPPSVGQYGMTREHHAGVVRRTVAAIRAVDSQREIEIDGLGGGNLAMPELADLDVIQSTRGYQPMPISHHEAQWWSGWQDAPAPQWPGLVYSGHTWDKETLRQFYQPWRDLEAQGVRVHVGEFGCFNRTPSDIALRWFADLFGLFNEFGWGYSLWEFKGVFGIIDHGRAGARWETIDGFNVDRDLFKLMLNSRVGQAMRHL
jgi:hypothetical protein